MKESRGKIQFLIDSTQNPARTHQKSDPLDQEKVDFEAKDEENHQQNDGRSENQSEILGTQQREHDEKDDEFETIHEELVNEEPTATKNQKEEREMEEKNGGPRERLKRHRTEIAGHVWIPDLWGQEELLMDWIDCSTFDSSLVPKGIISARASLIEEGRRATSSGIRVQNS